MLDNKGFDLWADGYDQSVAVCEASDDYPFAGYREVLGSIYRTIRQQEAARVLDIGLGTGVLAKRLYDCGYTITGVDFSPVMLRLAGEKMPGARLICHDFTQGLPALLAEESFDFIVSTYAIHHLADGQKLDFLTQLLARLTPGGKILLGDVAFPTGEALEACRKACGDRWDGDEHYPVVERLAVQCPQTQFEPISFCSGVITVENK